MIAFHSRLAMAPLISSLDILLRRMLDKLRLPRKPLGSDCRGEP